LRRLALVQFLRRRDSKACREIIYDLADVRRINRRTFLSGNGADPTGRKSNSLRTLQRRRRESSARGGVPSRLRLSARLYLSMEPRKEPNFSYRLLRAIYPAFKILFPNQVIRADDLAPGMVAARTVLGTGHTTFNLPMILV
jgi:hypothetical protein